MVEQRKHLAKLPSVEVAPWVADYFSRLKSAEEAVSMISSGARIAIGHAAGEPVVLVEELSKQFSRLTNCEIVHMIALGPSQYCQAPNEIHVRHNSLFAGPGSRQAIREGRADFTPVFFSEIPRLFRDGTLKLNVALLHLSLPDEDGYSSYGVSADYAVGAAEAADLLIAQINPKMPYTHGSKIHISSIDAIVEAESDLLAIPRPKIGEIERQIGLHIGSLVPDGANLQLGIGAIPDAVLLALTDKKDLGIHTEMMSDGVLELYQAGVINNKNNNLHPGKFTACFLLGTRALYDFVDGNPSMNIMPVDYTNHITVAGRVNNLTSINSAIEVDLMGQVCADSIGWAQYSGVGGQVDFVRAAALSPGGKSIIALASTAKNNTISKIKLKLTEGSAVTTSRNDVEYIITEYGIAHLRGKSLRARAEALINIAHPNFREALRAEAIQVGLL